MIRLSDRQVFWGILVLAAVLRILFLDIKPPHFDEGVNGLFIDQMKDHGFYHYDPGNYHGPLHFYVLFVSQKLFGRSLWALRMPIVLLSLLSVWLVCSFDRFIGRAASRWAALALAVSPAAVFYGRYAIHETWMLVFLLLITRGIARLWFEGNSKSLWECGMGITGMILTKETYFIHAGCFLLAVPTLLLLEKLSPSSERPLARQKWTWDDLGWVIAVSVGLILLFYSGFGFDRAGLKGLYQTFVVWTETGTEGHGHDKPFWYWLELLGRYEWPSAIGLLGGGALLLPRSDRFLRFLAIYGTGALVAFSIVPYKTPWCVLSIFWPFPFVFGALLAGTWREGGGGMAVRRVFVGLGIISLVVSLALCVRLNFFHFTDESEKYVYVQTFEDLDKLTGPVEDLVRMDPQNYALRGNIILEHYHPLPWVLGDFPNVGYYSPEKPPLIMDSDFLLINAVDAARFEQKLSQAYFKEPFLLRSGQEPSMLYLNARTFGAIFEDRVPEFAPRKRGGALEQ